jgi:hypothetical protein
MTWFTQFAAVDDKTINVSWFGVGWNRSGEHGPPPATATDIVSSAVLGEGGKGVFIMLIMFIDLFPTWCWAD